jgi:outer membrane protein assembly factor BamB
MKYILPAFALLALIVACSPKTETAVTDLPTVAAAPTLTLLWETDSVLTTCESVLFDEANNILYVANIAGDPGQKDGNGSIAKVTLDGKVENAAWVKGLDAPKGMGIANGKLYVADIDQIREIDLTSGAITKSYPVTGAQFLNDVTVDAGGKIYVSDMNTGKIILLENGTVSEYLTDQDHPNGLLAEDGRILMALWNPKTLTAIDANKQVLPLADSIDNPDGIEAVGDGGYLVSSWNGVVTYVDASGNTTVILDTTADQISAADIEYIPSRNLLLVPTFGKNTVAAYQLSK